MKSATCSHCKKEFSRRRLDTRVKNYYCSRDCFSKDVKKEGHGTTRHRRVKKRKGIEYLGGCCVRCGYNKFDGALQFHHKNPKEKSFNISTSSKGWEAIKKELDKCELLCANCHAEEHGLG